MVGDRRKASGRPRKRSRLCDRRTDRNPADMSLYILGCFPCQTYSFEFGMAAPQAHTKQVEPSAMRRTYVGTKPYEISEAQRARQIARRKEIYEVLHSGIVHGSFVTAGPLQARTHCCKRGFQIAPNGRINFSTFPELKPTTTRRL